MELWYILRGDDIVLFISFFILFIMSIISWCTLIMKLIKLIMFKYANKSFVKEFWSLQDLDSAYKLSLRSNSQMGYIVKYCYEHLMKYDKELNLHSNVCYDEYVKRIINDSTYISLRPFSFGLTALATIGSVSPFIGLFGTVWGIYHALIKISLVKQVSLAAVSQPIGEALVSTAFGLFVAIPSVLFYNYLIRMNSNLSYDIRNFANDFRIQLLSIRGKNE